MDKKANFERFYKGLAMGIVENILRKYWVQFSEAFLSMK